MKSVINILGILLIIAGVLALGYQGFTYTQKQQVAQLGDFKITAETMRTVNVPPVIGGLVLVAGIVLVVAGRKM